MTPEDDSIYSPPESSLEEFAGAPSGGGSIERALAGDIDFNVQEILGEAWRLVHGSKLTVFGFLMFAGGLNLVMQLLIVGVMSASDPESPMTLVLTFALGLIGGFAIAPLSAGMMYYAVKRAAGDPNASFATLRDCIPFIAPIIVASILTTILTLLGYLFLIIPGIYLAMCYIFAPLLIIDKGMGAWEALETSRKAVTKVWFRVFGLLFAATFLAMIGSLFTLGIGFIWAMPFTFLAIGVSYRNIFGYDGATA